MAEECEKLKFYVVDVAEDDLEIWINASLVKIELITS